MRRRRRWFSLLALAPLALACDALRAADPPNNPKDVPTSYGPCGSWVDCGSDQPKSDRCCPPTMACAVDDGGPYCAEDETLDPSDPVTWKRRARIHRRSGPP